jgi:aminopeptidase-like protein
MGEPQLGTRGVLPAASENEHMAILWMLNLSDGTNSLLDIVERSGLPFGELRHATEILVECGLLEECERQRR